MRNDGFELAASRAEDRRRLRLAILLTAGILVAEVVGAWWSGSLALLADAGHMFSDVAALAISLFALWFAGRPAPPGKTFGYYRMEILCALGNGLLLMVVLRSIPAGLVALVPNVLPIVVGFGLIGWMSVPLDVGTILTASIALGVALDDSLHFLHHPFSARRPCEPSGK